MVMYELLQNRKRKNLRPDQKQSNWLIYSAEKKKNLIEILTDSIFVCIL